jgi:hypothetical protein
MSNFIGNAHSLWKQLSGVPVADTFFHKSDDLLKSKHWILNSLRSKFSNEIIKNKSKSNLWMQTYHLKETVKIPGIDGVMLHIDKPKSDNQADKIEKLIRVLVTTMKLCALTFGPSKTSNLEIIVMLNDMKKRIPASKKLAVKHINSGFTTRGTDTIVAVFREEECHKVLIHELFHFWDIHSHDTNVTIPSFVPRGALLFESYVETLAAIVTCAYSEGDIQMVKARLDREVVHSEETRGRIERCDPGETSAWAYFVGKCYLLRDLDKFVKSVETNPGLYTKEQWSSFLESMKRGHDTTIRTPPVERVSGLIRMVSCDPE